MKGAGMLASRLGVLISDLGLAWVVPCGHIFIYLAVKASFRVNRPSLGTWC